MNGEKSGKRRYTAVNELPDDELAHMLKALASVSPGSDATHRALDRVRDALRTTARPVALPAGRKKMSLNLAWLAELLSMVRSVIDPLFRKRMHLNRVLIAAVVASLLMTCGFVILGAWIGQTPKRAEIGQTPKGDGRLEFMKSEARAYRLKIAGDRAAPLKLQEEPAFRLGKQPADDVEDGAIFFWVGEDHRPQASLQIFLVKNETAPNGMWAHEFNSLSTDSMVGTRRGRPSWSPNRPGLEYHRLDDVPQPAATATVRARQMRSIMRNFRATDFFKDRSWSDLRLLPTPVARYGKDGAAVIDGAVFLFVIGTDPEACVFLEVRQAKSAFEWFYAMGPLGCFSVKGFYNTKEVWDLPRRVPHGDPNEPYYITVEKL
jgi:hypothetical protein